MTYFYGISTDILFAINSTALLPGPGTYRANIEHTGKFQRMPTPWLNRRKSTVNPRSIIDYNTAEIVTDRNKLAEST